MDFFSELHFFCRLLFEDSKHWNDEYVMVKTWIINDALNFVQKTFVDFSLLLLFVCLFINLHSIFYNPRTV